MALFAKIVLAYTLYSFVGMCVAGFDYKNRQASSCLEGAFVVLFWPFVLFVRFVQWVGV
jgi:hypothetical protein